MSKPPLLTTADQDLDSYTHFRTQRYEKLSNIFDALNNYTLNANKLYELTLIISFDSSYTDQVPVNVYVDKQNHQYIYRILPQDRFTYLNVNEQLELPINYVTSFTVALANRSAFNAEKANTITQHLNNMPDVQRIASSCTNFFTKSKVEYRDTLNAYMVFKVTKDEDHSPLTLTDLEEFKAPQGGTGDKVKVLGRLRKIHNDGRNKFIVYQKQRLSLAEAKKLEDHQRSHSMPKKTTPKKTTTPEKTTPKKTTTPEKTTPEKTTPKKITPKKTTTPEKTTSKKTRPVSVSRTS